MTRTAIILLAAAAAGCASPPPQVVTQPVNIAVPVKCPVKVSPEPAYPDTDAALRAAPDIYDGVKLLKAGRLLRIKRESELLAAAIGCGVVVTK